MTDIMGGAWWSAGDADNMIFKKLKLKNIFKKLKTEHITPFGITLIWVKLKMLFSKLYY